jgi:hypothetical protein
MYRPRRKPGCAVFMLAEAALLPLAEAALLPLAEAALLRSAEAALPKPHVQVPACLPNKSGLRSRRGEGVPRGAGARPTCVCCQPGRVVLWYIWYVSLRLSRAGSFSFRFHALAVVLTYPGPLGRPQRLKQRPALLLSTTTTTDLSLTGCGASHPAAGAISF